MKIKWLAAAKEVSKGGAAHGYAVRDWFHGDQQVEEVFMGCWCPYIDRRDFTAQRCEETSKWLQTCYLAKQHSHGEVHGKGCFVGDLVSFYPAGCMFSLVTSVVRSDWSEDIPILEAFDYFAAIRRRRLTLQLLEM